MRVRQAIALMKHLPTLIRAISKADGLISVSPAD